MVSLTELAASSPALLARHVWLHSSWFCSAPNTPASLAFVHYYTRWDELEGNPFKCWEQYPCGKKEFLPGSGQGRGWCHPPWLLWKLRVTLKTQFPDVIPRRKMLGAWFMSVRAQRAWIVFADLGQLKWYLLPENLSASYKFNFSLQWQMVGNNNK